MKHTQLFKMFFATIMVALSITGAHAQGTITTVGTGFSQPYGVATDPSGNIYVADEGTNAISMISASTGVISPVVHGSGFDPSGFMPSMGGLAINAVLTMPDAIFVDHSGDIFFTDWYNDAACKIDAATSHITNICGHEDQGCGGDGGDAPLATMCIPGGVWVDNSGNAYMVDYGNNRIRKIDAATGIVNTIAGAGSGGIDGVPAISASFGQINGVCVDNYGNIYISDAGYHTVRKIDNAGIIRTIAGTGLAGYSGDGGSALSAKMYNPGCLYINAAGNLFICDNTENCVRVMNIGTEIIHTLAGTGVAGFSGDGGSPTVAKLNNPMGVWQDATGAIYIADEGNSRIRKVTGTAYRTTSTNTLTQSDVNIFPNPSTGTFTVQTNTVSGNGSIEVYNVIGEKVFSTAISQQQETINLNQPAGVYNVVIKTASGTTSEKITIAK